MDRTGWTVCAGLDGRHHRNTHPLRGAANVKVTGMGVFLYALVLYSRHPLGEEFWQTTLDSADKQLQMKL